MSIVWKPRTLPNYSATSDGPMVILEPYAKGVRATDDPDMLMQVLTDCAPQIETMRVGHPKRDKARTRMAKNSRKRNRA